MAVHIIIDGYNFIRQAMSFRFLQSRDLRQERDLLVDSLVRFKRGRSHGVTVVFDGTRAPFDLPRKQVQQGVEVVFSPPGQTADATIKQMAAREREKALVVTSDREISDFVLRRGAAVIGSADFERLLSTAWSRNGGEPSADETDDDAGWPGTTRKRGPSFRLSRKERHLKNRLNKL